MAAVVVATTLVREATSKIFYRNLTEEVRIGPRTLPPMLTRDGPYWRVQIEPDSEFFVAFITPHWNEVLNPSNYARYTSGRLRALVRRAHGRPEPVLSLGEIELNPAARTVARAGEAVELTPREFDLLHLLLRNAERVLTRRSLEEQLYTWNDAVDSNALEVHIHHLRRKLGNDLIRTVRGVGYMAAVLPDKLG